MLPINRNLPRPSTLCLLTTVCLAAWLAFGRPSAQPQPAQASVQATSKSTPISRIKPISEVQLGERAIGKNPLREQVDESLPEPDPQTWRKLTLRLPKENGRWLTVELLRPLDWIEDEEAAVGETIYLDLEEMGAIGDAEVVSIEPCPPIQPGKANIITGKFIHEVEQGEVIELRFAHQLEATRVTKNHPYWSADRHDFIPAGELREGEQVESLTGPTRVASITPSDYSGLVYNLEIHGEHVYRVGSSGLLAHNACTRQLRQALNTPRGGGAAHHIVAPGAMNPNAVRARNTLQQAGVSLESNWNGVMLNPKVHNPLHTDNYYRNVANAVESGFSTGGSQGVVDVLQRIDSDLSSGRAHLWR